MVRNGSERALGGVTQCRRREDPSTNRCRGMRGGSMGKENFGRSDLGTPVQRRRRPSDITNLSASFTASSQENPFLKSSSVNRELELHQENMVLKKLLSEKEASLAAQVDHIERLQKEFMSQLRRQSQVNEEIICYNSRLSKEGILLRDQLKLLQHEYSQMGVMYKITQTELQIKLVDTQEQLKALLAESEAKKTAETCLNVEPLTVLRKPKSFTHRRHSTAGAIEFDTNWNSSTKVEFEHVVNNSVCRSGLRSRANSTPVHKEFSLRTRVVQPENAVISSGCSPKHVNKYCSHAFGLETMQEVSENEDASSADFAREQQCTSSSEENVPSSYDIYPTNESDNVIGLVEGDSHSESTNETRQSGSDTETAKEREPSKHSTRKTTVSSQVPSSVPHFSRRGSAHVQGSCRPIRKAAESVATYREPPLNTKMRRSS